MIDQNHVMVPIDHDPISPPMKLLVINPNTDAALTEFLVGFAAEAVPDTQVAGATATFGPDYIRTAEDSETALRAVAALLDDVPSDFDAAMIASSSDTGLALARARLSVPVAAMTQSAMTEAAKLAPRFACIGFQKWGETLMAELAETYGFAGQFAGTRIAGSGIAGVIAAGRAAIDEDGAGALIVGGASMCADVGELAERLCVPVLDGVRCAARQARALAGLSVSKKAPL